jgi:lysozyme
MSQRRPIPPRALDLIKTFEGCSLRAYRCPAGVLTIGYGHTGPVDGHPITLSTVISQPLAEALLAGDVRSVAEDIERATRVKLTDGQFGALVSFAFNFGWARLAGSTLWRKLQAGNAKGAAAEFDKWTYAKGKNLPGLVRRRADERAMFESNP